ncbi:protoporphyrinogen oxidase [Nesterenkonia muleiensis]|uniref:protoporphyrinogen oxidase n=1 Tax=Nesterenkonia muleiensis TaxID=2282648 RepID=UPI000E72C1CD|nr:protoporphyrinogen oxidase [Nesterenkonia muleiensis]
MARVAVVGGGIAGLTAAWELARAGVQVDLFEATDRLGGVIAPVTLSGVQVDAGAEAFATRVPAVGEFLADLGLEEQIVSPNPAGAWLQLPEFAAPLPATGILGIPGEPGADDVAAILGAQHAARAAEDLRAPMTWTAGQSPSLGEVVAERMGPAVVEKLVAPITSGVHSADPYDLAVSAAHPQLYRAMLAEGSLATAVSRLRAAAPAGSAVQSLWGGMSTLISALEAQLRDLGVNIHLNTGVSEVQVHRNGVRMGVILADSHLRPGRGEVEAEHLIMAVEGPEVEALLGQESASAARHSAQSGVALVTLLVHAPELDSHPRGTGMLVAPSNENIRAKAMTHISAKWAWAAEALEAKLGPGHHLLRLSYGRVNDSPGALGFGSSDRDLITAAIADLPHLTGAPVAGEQIVDRTVVRWQRGLPGGGAAQRGDAEDLKAALAIQGAEGGPQLAAVGSWFAGTGLAQVIPDARAQARELCVRLAEEGSSLDLRCH